MKNKKGFTLVELLAVIAILAILVLIALPNVVKIFNEAKKTTLETSAKMIASGAEKAKMQNELLLIQEDITCDSVSTLSKDDYSNCTITFDSDNKAIVSINGSGRFKGLNICNATKNSANVSEDKCPTDSSYFTYDTFFDENAFVYEANLVDINKCVNFMTNNWLYSYEKALASCNNDIENGNGGNLQQNATNAIYYKYTSNLTEIGLKGKYKKITNVEITNKDSCNAYLTNLWGNDYTSDIELNCNGEENSYEYTIKDYIQDGSIAVEDFETAGLIVTMEDYTQTAIITGYDIDGGENVVIPKEIDGFKVEEILNYALYNEKIKSIDIPNTITKVNDCAFGDKSRLTSSNISSSYTCNNKPTNGALTLINKIGERDILNSSAKYNNRTYHAGIRYIGDDSHNSKNYVKYNCDDDGLNCEIWRIIGVFNVEGKQRIKLINTFSTFRTTWDSSSNKENGGNGINQWGPSVYEDGTFYEGADLYQLLNGFYIGESTTCGNSTFSQTCTTESLTSANMKPLTNNAKSLISNVNWSTNPSSWYITPSYRYPLYSNVEGVYLREIGVIQTNFANYCDSRRVCDDTVVRTKETNALVGLMSLSDFGYTLVNNDLSMNKYTFINDNGLRFWLLTPNVIKLRVFTAEEKDNSYPASGAEFAVFPSVYLKSNVNLIGTGDNLGSINNPYTLSID